MTRLPMSVVKFAGENNLDAYEGMRDYFFHFMSERHNKNIGAYDSTVSFAEKEEKMNKALFSEIKRVSGQSLDETISLRAWAQNPMVKWATNAVVDSMIDAVLPETIIASIGVYTDVDSVGYGETKQYDIEPNSLFTVSEGSNAQRRTFRQKQFKTSKTLVPVNHSITVSTSLYKVLCGKESLAEYVRKAIISLQTEMTKDAYGALVTLIEGGTFPTQLKQTGYTQDKLLGLCEVVTAYNEGNRATIVGTSQALAKILPDQAAGYRITTPADGIGIQLIKNFMDYDILVLPQVATGKDYGLALSNKEVYIMSTGSDSIIKGAMEGTTTANTNDVYANADLTQNTTMNKRWVFEAVTNATMGVLKFE